VHGTADDTVPYALAERLVERGRELGVRVELHALQDQGHADWSSMEQYVAWIHAFLRSISL